MYLTLEDYRIPTIDLISKICVDKTVADFSCGTGWAGRTCLQNRAKFVKFSDARTHRIILEDLTSFTNYSIEFVDLNFPNNHKDYLKDVDLIIYFGHFYHATNHEEILNYMLNSTCKEFLIDSKMFMDQDKEESDILWMDEPVDEMNIWHPGDFKEISIGRPNLSWTLELLRTKNVKIKQVIKVKSRNASHPIHDYINYVIHFIKN